MASYGICRIQKCKGSQVASMQYHNDREPGLHANRDIDPERSHLNREMVAHGDYEAEIQARIDAGYTGSRKVRKDAVRLVEGIVTASPEWFEGARQKDVDAFFRAALAFVEGEFGKENLIHFTIHMDETTPHAHFGFVPLRDGKLSFKEFFAGRKQLSEFQDRFFEKVAEPFGLERGERRDEGAPTVRHRTVAEYKSEVARLEKRVEETENRLECLRQAEVEIAQDVAQLEERIAEASRERAVARGRVDGLARAVEEVKNACGLIAHALARAVREVAGFAERIGLGNRDGFAWIDRFGAGAELERANADVGIDDLENAARAASRATDRGLRERETQWQR